MFAESEFNGNISEWNVSNVKILDSMFEDSKFNKDISNWKIDSDTSFKNMFEENMNRAYIPYDIACRGDNRAFAFK